VGIGLISGSHALLNHFGIRVTTMLTDFSGWLIAVVALLLTIAMLRVAPAFDLGRLVAFADFGGVPAGHEVWPSARGIPTMTLLALTWPIYTITGFDASAHTSEETVQAAHNVPKGILRSVYVSGLVGWVMVASFRARDARRRRGRAPGKRRLRLAHDPRPAGRGRTRACGSASWLRITCAASRA
jgi:amino acid transporter